MLVAELRELDRVESSVVVSFDSAVVRELHVLAPELALSPGLQELTAWLVAGEPLAEHYSVIQVPPTSGGIPVLTREVVQRAHAEGLDVWVWAASAEHEQARVYRDWLALGVYGVIAGRPAEMTAARWRAEQGRAERASGFSRMAETDRSVAGDAGVVLIRPHRPPTVGRSRGPRPLGLDLHGDGGTGGRREHHSHRCPRPGGRHQGHCGGEEGCAR